MDRSVDYLPSLTALRGLAALWVMLFHIDVSLFYRDLGPVLPHDWSGLITSGYLWVDFFFILSGFVITHVYSGKFAHGWNQLTAIQYIRARFLRIYPLHFFTLILLLVFSQFIVSFYPTIMDDSLRSYFDFAALPSNLLLTNAMKQHVYLSWNIVSWSIGAEWWTYFVAIGLLILVAKVRALGAALFIGLGFSLLILLRELHPGSNLDITFDYGFFRCLFEFTIGVGLYQIYRAGFARHYLSKDISIFAIFALLVIIFHWKLNDLWAIPLFALLTIASAYNRATTHRFLDTKPLQYLGKISYSVYLMHGVWFMVFWAFLPIIKQTYQIEQMPLAPRIFYLALFVTLSVASAALTYRYVEVPGRKIFLKRNASVAA